MVKERDPALKKMNTEEMVIHKRDGAYLRPKNNRIFNEDFNYAENITGEDIYHVIKAPGPGM